MAQRRMFSPEIVESDAFLDMPSSSQALYFHLGMYADDDGFVNPKKIMRLSNSSDDDLKVLIGKRFVLPFENGVIVIKHWRINNLIRKDWHRQTKYVEQLKRLTIKENGSYTELVNESLTSRQHSIVLCSEVKSNNSVPSTPKIEESEELKEFKPLKENLKWQLEALEAIKFLSATKKSSIFKCYKDNSPKARFALNDCKELGKLNELYFLKVYNELIKK